MIPIVFMFSGQGSQYFQMGRELFENHAAFSQSMHRMDEMVKKAEGISVIEHLYDETKNKMDVFNQPKLTSLSIIMVEYALAQVLLRMGIEPDYILGSSLGEVTGAILAGVIDLEETLAFVAKRMTSYETYCEEGGMICILNDPRLYDTSPELRDFSELAAVNFDSHFIVACKKAHISLIENFCSRNNIIFQTIPNVSKGYHSSLLDPARPFIQRQFGEMTYRSPKINFISVTHAREITSLNGDYFWNVFRRPLLFQKTIQMLEAQGDYLYLDLGPSGTLATFVKYNLTSGSRSRVFPIFTPFGGDQARLNEVRQYLNTIQSIGETNANICIPRSRISNERNGRSVI